MGPTSKDIYAELPKVGDPDVDLLDIKLSDFVSMALVCWVAAVDLQSQMFFGSSLDCQILFLEAKSNPSAVTGLYCVIKGASMLCGIFCIFHINIGY